MEFFLKFDFRFWEDCLFIIVFGVYFNLIMGGGLWKIWKLDMGYRVYVILIFLGGMVEDIVFVYLGWLE